MKGVWIAAFTLPMTAYAFHEQPWLGNLWEFNFSGDFTYSRYREVEGASRQISAPSNDKLLRFDLGLTPSTRWDAQLEVEFADTPRQSLGMRSVAAYGRILWMDDVAGDPLSWTTGLSVRGVSGHSLHDVSCPYHSNVDIELNSALGKEWARGPFWTTHVWGLVGIGIANHGSPWMRLLGCFEKNWSNHHRLGAFVEGYVGWGERRRVDVDHFNGWGKYQHRSLDLGLLYRYHFDIWGDLSVAYTQRVFAHTFPEYVHFFTLAYQIPFTLF